MRGIQSRYTYNHTGERSLKRYGAYESMAVNGAAAGSLLDPKSAYSAYVSPYYVEHGRGTESGAVTKHYYAGAERLISKVVTSATGAKGESQNGNQSSAQTEESTYYYFTDHLGSTTHITDRSGRTSQYAAYTPYGELFREYKKVLPYKFNGKELDQETGYYYYGARYYDPGTVLWFGTDPLAHINPQVSPYVYCQANPIRRIDPNGMLDYDIDGMDDTKWHGFNVDEDVIVLDEFDAESSKQSCNQNYNQQTIRLATSYISTGIEGLKVESSFRYDSYKNLAETMELYVGDGTVARDFANKYKIVSKYAKHAGRIITGISIASDVVDIWNDGLNSETFFNISLDAIAATGLKGAFLSTTLDTYRIAFKYVRDAYFYMNSRLKCLENWYNCYNFGY